MSKREAADKLRVGINSSTHVHEAAENKYTISTVQAHPGRPRRKEHREEVHYAETQKESIKEKKRW